jgi:lipoprotein NlpD
MSHFYSKIQLITLALLLSACAEEPTEPLTPSEPAIAPTPKKIPKPKSQLPDMSLELGKKQIVYHEVMAGETLYSIGVQSGVGYQRLAQWNNIKPPYAIKRGQKIALDSLSESPKPKLENSTAVYQKTPIAAENSPSLKEKKSSISIDNGSMLKLNFKWPLRGAVVGRFSEAANKGIDIEGLEGQPVRASAAGIVVHSGVGLLGYGKLLIIKHNDDYLSAYSNNEQLLVSQGQTVEQGQAIAELGNTGIKNTVLHFEIRKNGKPVNPLELLSPP